MPLWQIRLRHQRVKQTLTHNAPTNMMGGTTWYLHGDNNALVFEKELKANGVTENRHYLQAAGMTFALVTTRSGAGVSTTASDLSKRSAQVRYFHQDHLNSMAVITDEAGQVVERLAYDPWGKRRNANGLADKSDSLVGQTTDRGYTEHEHLDEVGLSHMNGRVYDPLIGRFMSADPHVTDPGKLQSFNRYSYVMNNPLFYTDPTGFDFWSDFVDDVVKPVAKIAVVAVVASYTGGLVTGSEWALCTASGATWSAVAAGAAGGFAAGATGAALNGANLNQSLQAGLQGGFTGALFGAASMAGGYGEAGTNSYARYAAHAGAGCVSSVASGGNCGQGAASAVFGKFTTSAISGFGDAGTGSVIARGVATMVAGGIGSVIAGGKFANGAETAAYGYLFNQLATHANGKPNLSPNLARTSYVVAEGGQFSMYDADGKLIDQVAFTSGRDGMNDPSVKDRGPFPPGTYTLDPKNITSNGPNTLLSGDWSALRVSLTPTGDTNTFGRSGFYIHGGFAPGSAGCIDLGTPTDLRVLGQFKNLSSPIEVRVR